MVRKVQELFDNPEHDDCIDEDLEYIKSSKKNDVEEDKEEDEHELDEYDDLDDCEE